MLVNNGFTFRYRGIAKFSTQRERESIIKYAKTIPTKVFVFDNTMEQNILILDFEDHSAWEEFNELFFHKRKTAENVVQIEEAAEKRGLRVVK